MDQVGLWHLPRVRGGQQGPLRTATQMGLSQLPQRVARGDDNIAAAMAGTRWIRRRGWLSGHCRFPVPARIRLSGFVGLPRSGRWPSII
ncbi:hypothetical protein MAJHIDBO_01373 [Propionibacterium freudenreichii subsp. shermanii]|nr:hypothetical protein MAJHIDBO_01373 [Propionibacterium freudenreichii subsp. shermanii]SPS09167.1 hypothetical protein MAJHIDBO_01373 [Propionibacterium freudenreichii subsp. shermanii]